MLFRRRGNMSIITPEGVGWALAVGRVIWVPLGMIYPVFLRVWFLRPNIRRQVVSWGR
jgi:hypothetical protein